MDLPVNRFTGAVLESVGAPGPNARWLADNAAAVRKSYADMLREREGIPQISGFTNGINEDGSPVQVKGAF